MAYGSISNPHWRKRHLFLRTLQAPQSIHRPEHTINPNNSRRHHHADKQLTAPPDGCIQRKR
jgi:hypothetical protein